MIELHITDNDITHGNIAISWCLDKDTLTYLKEKSDNPHLVIVVSPVDNYHASKELRKVIPLKDLMGYIDFKCAGPNKIWAFVYSSDSKAYMETRYCSKEQHYAGGSVYSTNLLDYEGVDWLCSYKEPEPLYSSEEDENPIFVSLVSDPIVVNVPAGCFAPEPAQWEKTWVNHFFRQKVVDQCDFRRRRLFAYGVQPFVMFFNLLIRLIFTVLSFGIGCRGFSLKYLLHPLMYSLKDTADVIDFVDNGIIFVRKLPEDDTFPDMPFWNNVWYVIRKGGPLLFMPIIIIPVVLLILNGLLIKFLIVVGMTLGIVLAVLGIIFISANFNGVRRFFSKVFNKLLALTATTPLDIDDQQLLICNGKPVTKLSDLPRHKRTVKLRFQNIKSKVCRPFSA